MRGLILQVIDFFYPLFRRVMPLQTFRYAACGGFNTIVDISLYIIGITFIFTDPVFFVGPIAMKPHIAAFLAAFSVSFPLGFYFSRYVVFTESNLRGRVQLIRYFILVLTCIALNYVFIKFFVEQLLIVPTVAKILTTVIVVAFSYLSQKHFTFKVKTIKRHVDGAEPVQVGNVTMRKRSFEVRKMKIED